MIELKHSTSPAMSFKPMLALVAIQGDLFEKMCVRCVQFIAEYDCFCDSCAADYEYSWWICLSEHGFKDYSQAVKKIGRKKINKIYEEGKYFETQDWRKG